MLTSIRTHLATQPNSTLLESLANLADRAFASENDEKETIVGVSEINVKESTKIIGLIEDILKRLERLETSGAKKKHFNNKQSAASRDHRTFVKSPAFPDVNAKPFVPNAPKNQDRRQCVFPVNQKVAHPTAPPPDRQHNKASTLFHTDNSQVCYYHQIFGDKERMCREPCVYFKLIGQRKVATLVSGEPVETRHDYTPCRSKQHNYYYPRYMQMSRPS